MTDPTPASQLDRVLAAAPDRVWRALTSADELAAWLWPPAWETTCDVDLRVGGRYRIASATTGMAVHGEYLAIEAPTRLVQTWAWEGDAAESLVTMTLSPTPDGTHLEIRHERLATEQERALHAQGWNDCLDRLPEHLRARHTG